MTNPAAQRVLAISGSQSTRGRVGSSPSSEPGGGQRTRPQVGRLPHTRAGSARFGRRHCEPPALFSSPRSWGIWRVRPGTREGLRAAPRLARSPGQGSQGKRRQDLSSFPIPTPAPAGVLGDPRPGLREASWHRRRRGPRGEEFGPPGRRATGHQPRWFREGAARVFQHFPLT